MDNDYISGLSILGGEPLELVNQKGLIPLVNKVKEKLPNKNIWCYTGYDFDKDIINIMYKKYDFTREFLKKIDIIVDGQFIEEKKLTDLKFRGSYNQRKIDVQESIKANKTVSMKFGDESRYEEKNPKIIWIANYTNEKDIPIYTNELITISEDDNSEEQRPSFVSTKEKIKISAKRV